MGTTRLLLYNGALLALGERELSSLTDATPSRRYLDQAWNAGFVDEVLNAGQWTFATRTQQLTHDDSVETEFGHTYAFPIPTDCVRLTALCADEFFNIPLRQYQVEKGYYFASVDPIYVSYVSNDASYGGDLSKWNADFCEYARLRLAEKIIPRLTNNKTDRGDFAKLVKMKLREAKSSNAMDRPPGTPPVGTWVNARMRGRASGGWDGGNRSSLIG
jgi:hypothetical protein